MNTAVITRCELTCPSCGNVTEEAMPLNACIFFDDCVHCGAMLRPKPGDCCVFCSYGSVPCPPVQQERGCCAPRPPSQ